MLSFVVFMNYVMEMKHGLGEAISQTLLVDILLFGVLAILYAVFTGNKEKKTEEK